MTAQNDKYSNKTAWIESGFQFLAEGGIDSVRVDRISKKIGLTRGSFYWHFKNRDELLDAMLELWQKKGTSDVIKLIENEQGNPSKKLSNLLKISSQSPDEKYGGKYAEMAIRIWGSKSPKAANIIAQIDNERVAFVNKLLIEMKLDPAHASFLAEIIYNAYIGMMSRDLPEEHVLRMMNLASSYISAQAVNS